MGQKSLIAVSLCVLATVFPAIVVFAASVTLQNGDVIIGSINQEKVPFQAKVGKVEIKADEIVSFEDGKLQLKDGTTIVGNFTKGSLDISTSWGGTVSVKAQDITKIVQEGGGVREEISKLESKPEPRTKLPDDLKPVERPYDPPPPRGPTDAPVLDAAGNVIGIAPPPYSPHRPPPALNPPAFPPVIGPPQKLLHLPPEADFQLSQVPFAA